VLPVCQTADQIVVYCNGGGCEDSEFAAVILGNAGIPMTRLSVYGGGLWEWATNGLPIEIGERNSGNLRKPSP
jgi:rhodanese-related sulfurtransferase